MVPSWWAHVFWCVVMAEDEGELAGVRFSALGTTVVLLLAAGTGLDLARAERMLRADLAELDRVCSRFRADSEIRGLEARAGTVVVVSPLLAAVLDAALRGAVLSEGLVDPTVGAAVRASGYDRDFAAVPPEGPPLRVGCPAPGWWRIGWDAARHEVLLPRGVQLDVGASAKAWAADRAAARIAVAAGVGVLVSLGGDIAVCGEAPVGGWRIEVGDDHRRADPDGGVVVTITAGGLATSGTVRRRWRRGERTVHHIMDPRTGEPATGGWRTISVAAGSCLDANIASTAAVVLGAAAPRWLGERGLPARLVDDRGRVHTVGGWPAQAELSGAGAR